MLFFDNGSEDESERRRVWVDVWVDTSVGVKKRQPEINSADLQLVNDRNRKINLKTQSFTEPLRIVLDKQRPHTGIC